MSRADGPTRASATADQPGSDGPDGPDPPDPTDDLPDPSEVSTDLRVTFWLLVFLIKVTLIATTVGVLFVVYENDWEIGGPLIGLGVLCSLFAVVRYRQFRRSETRGEGSEASS